jgi:hypothetical protein
MFPERAEKGPDFGTVLLHLFSLECIENLVFSNIFIPEMVEKFCPISRKERFFYYF